MISPSSTIAATAQAAEQRKLPEPGGGIRHFGDARDMAGLPIQIDGPAEQSRRHHLAVPAEHEQQQDSGERPPPAPQRTGHQFRDDRDDHDDDREFHRQRRGRPQPIWSARYAPSSGACSTGQARPHRPSTPAKSGLASLRPSSSQLHPAGDGRLRSPAPAGSSAGPAGPASNQAWAWRRTRARPRRARPQALRAG